MKNSFGLDYKGAGFFNAEQVNIEKLTVRNGDLEIINLPGNRVLNLENIQSEISAQSLLGPWRLEGKSNVNGYPSTFQISTGRYLAIEKSMRLRVDGERADLPYQFSLDGTVLEEDEALLWDGSFSFRAKTEEQLAAMVQRQEPLPINLQGLFEANSKTISVPDYRLAIGQTWTLMRLTARRSFS